jgi:tetratricopeptide (TPR) repeat protein
LHVCKYDYTYMKKVFLLFTFLLAATTLVTRAQTGGVVDSISYQPQGWVLASARFMAPTDTSRHLLADNESAKYVYKNIIKVAPPVNAPFTSVSDEELQASLNIKIADKMAHLKELFADDTLYGSPRQKMPPNISSLKQQVGLVTNDTIRAKYYQTIATYYLRYDSITVKKTRQAYQDGALEYTMKALHSYSRTNDSNGLRISFNNLVKVYKDQRKFSQAKWFILQSNTISRQQNDTRNIISSLVELASIKMAIKDYKLAQRDLDEALTLSSQNHFSKQESMVQSSFASLYDKLNDPKKSIAALKRHDFIEDSITKADQARTLAALKAQDSVQMSKKKLLTSVSKKPSKINSPKKPVSL